MSDKELLQAVLKLEAEYGMQPGWEVECSVVFRDRNDTVRNIHTRPDYKLAMKYIRDRTTYDLWVERYFGTDADVDKVLVFATVSRDLHTCVNNIYAFRNTYAEWMRHIVPGLDYSELSFLEFVWSSCKFI